MLAQTRTGKQILNVKGNREAKLCIEIKDEHDHVAVIGTNRKMLVFLREEMPEMSRGKGVIIQRYKGGEEIADIQPFNMEEGLSFAYGSGVREVEDVGPWMGKRAQVGRLPPNGFPRNNKFFG